ncbi:MAG TPA: hypothetical protein VKR31_02515 [Rhizomicrobium sp.]|nr:hypothetical protein [Rhizomicrobium sp.]
MNTRWLSAPTRRWREWLDPFLALVALAVSAISLWVAIGTEQANRRMVAAASWPLLQADTSNLNSTITFSVLNGGVGPAKLKTFELFWNGNAYPGAQALLKACCGYRPSQSSEEATLTTGGVSGIVIRAGETHTFLSLPKQTGNDDVWRKLDRMRRQVTFRACYCSVFDECWIGGLRNLEPRRVDKCPPVPVLYVE